MGVIQTLLQRKQSFPIIQCIVEYNVYILFLYNRMYTTIQCTIYNTMYFTILMYYILCHTDSWRNTNKNIS
jgi:hypothetical protein